MKKIVGILFAVSVITLMTVMLAFAAFKNTIVFTLAPGETQTVTIATPNSGAIGSMQVKLDAAATGTMALMVDRITGVIMTTNGPVSLVTSNITLFSESFSNVTAITWFPEGKIYIADTDVLKTVQTLGTNGLAWVQIVE